MIIKEVLRRFARERRSAIAIIMAASTLPLMLLVGIAIDFTLLSQARSQAAFAAQAAATHAVRVAASTYALEVQNGSTSAVAVAHAQTAANTAGDLWWGAELGALSQGYVSAEQTNTTVTNANSSPPSFNAQVGYTIKYPPIFDPLFGQPNTVWAYASSASATAQFAYAQILMMLDTSNSMLIGARTSDIQTMETNAVCPATGTLAANGFGSSDALKYYTGANTDYDFAPGDNTFVGFKSTDTIHALNYNASTNSKQATGTEPDPTIAGSEPAITSMVNGKSGYLMDGQCNSGYNIAGSPFEPCALACHNTTTKSASGFYEDLYGLARAEGVKLRVDVLYNATETAISDMKSTEAVANQISVGIYQFNSDIAPIVRGNTATGDALPEATSNLDNALAAVKGVDYAYTPGAASDPPMVTDCNTYNFPSHQSCAGNTNLVLSLQHLVAGKLPTDSNAQPLSAAGSGTTGTAPIKFMFLITDGMEGESSLGGATDLNTNPNFAGKGVMTNTTDNTAVTSNSATPGTCTALKKLGYIVYVLYVDYLPVSETQYYAQANSLSPQTTSDYPNAKYLVDVADSQPYIVAGETAAQETAQIETHVPTAEALAQCASSPAYFYSASDDVGIQTALSQMLKSALASTTRLTN